jgi:hypothetical protein
MLDKKQLPGRPKEADQPVHRNGSTAVDQDDFSRPIETAVKGPNSIYIESN